MTLFDNFKRLFGGGRSNGAERNGDSEMIACHDALRLVQEFLDGELDGMSHTDVEAHFEMCKRCYPHLRLERQFRAAVHRAGADETAPPELRAQVLDMVSGGQSDA